MLGIITRAYHASIIRVYQAHCTESRSSALIKRRDHRLCSDIPLDILLSSIPHVYKPSLFPQSIGSPTRATTERP